MPWITTCVREVRARFIAAWKNGVEGFAALCRRFGISRQTGYQTLRRFHQEGAAGLAVRSRKPKRLARLHHRKWRRRLRQLRVQYPYWGAKKLHSKMEKRYGKDPVPHRATLGRWLREGGWTRAGRRRQRHGPLKVRRALSTARQANAVWTVDFKGWFRTGDGHRCEPLTVRDLFSRFILLWELLPDQSYERVRGSFVRCFRRFGVPATIRVDNGGPFGSNGPAGLSRLSVWWMRLGIGVEFIRPGCPQDNGAHERMHGDYQRETLRAPAASRAAQVRRTRQFVERYNWDRPHEALAQRTPAELYRSSTRDYQTELLELLYPLSWTVRRVRSNGMIKWEGRQRFIGQAFVGQRIGLKTIKADVQEVYFARTLLGTLHATDRGGLRPAKYLPAGKHFPTK